MRLTHWFRDVRLAAVFSLVQAEIQVLQLVARDHHGVVSAVADHQYVVVEGDQADFSVRKLLLHRHDLALDGGEHAVLPADELGGLDLLKVLLVLPGLHKLLQFFEFGGRNCGALELRVLGHLEGRAHAARDVDAENHGDVALLVAVVALLGAFDHVDHVLLFGLFFGLEVVHGVSGATELARPDLTARLLGNLQLAVDAEGGLAVAASYNITHTHQGFGLG